MGLLTVGTPLEWKAARTHATHVRTHGLAQFLSVWDGVKARRRDRLLWGDEIEYLGVVFDDAARSVRAAAATHGLLLRLESDERDAIAKG
ncbi:hypothetical protein HK100_002588 [Physocladia obscura]|uniref:Glutamate--cysteine ligase n=1 Tax=Physocladia obscura TaxID=109957 RepID=A0AAD5T162_9FUNG|nr:hypothetical protein HK100_002588 [Physocladia obscura]